MNYPDGTDSIMEFTKIFFCDLNGRIMNLSVNGMDIDDIFHNGVGFDGSSIAGFANVENSDRLLFPVKESMKKIKFKGESIDFYIGNICDEHGERSGIDTRTVLQKTLNRAKDEYGFTFLAGPEHEFFLLNGNEFETTGENVGDSSHTDKAYIAEKEAPILKSWGFRNRSSMIRIPYTARPENTRIELRSPAPSGNVYLQLAILIAMGMRGISLSAAGPVYLLLHKNFY